MIYWVTNNSDGGRFIYHGSKDPKGGELKQSLCGESYTDRGGETITPGGDKCYTCQDIEDKMNRWSPGEAKMYEARCEVKALTVAVDKKVFDLMSDQEITEYMVARGKEIVTAQEFIVMNHEKILSGNSELLRRVQESFLRKKE